METTSADAARHGRRSSAKRLIAAAALGAVAAIVCVLGFWRPGYFVTTELNVGKVETGVQEMLTDEINGYGAHNVKDVSCNRGVDPVMQKDGMFDCTATIDGEKREVTVTIQDDDGTYEVGRPR